MEDTGPKQRSKSVRSKNVTHKPLVKMASLPPNFVFPFNSIEEKNMGLIFGELIVLSVRLGSKRTRPPSASPPPGQHYANGNPD
ncbi:UNVERIFIED_CONTAM: hypothetical protein NCL1_23254 [Trichonephila clavipes]